MCMPNPVKLVMKLPGKNDLSTALSRMTGWLALSDHEVWQS